MKYAFCGGKLLDGTREMQPREGLVLRTDGDRITDIVPEGTDLTGYEVVDLKGGYLMPGLINMHVHLAGSGKPQKKQRTDHKNHPDLFPVINHGPDHKKIPLRGRHCNI